MDTRRSITTLAILLAATSIIITGCHVEQKGHGDADNVKVTTPFGDMHAKTNDPSVLQGLGLPIYPGAQFQESGKLLDTAIEAELVISLDALRDAINARAARAADR